jgi:hypothetical protein
VRYGGIVLPHPLLRASVLARFVSLVVLLLCGAHGAWAQPLRIEADGIPLEQALDQLRDRASLDIVFANRLVEGRTARCTYRGNDRRAALRCVLSETGLRAERVRRGQYVIVASERAPTGGGSLPSAPRVDLTGYVKDAQTGVRLPGAHVYLSALDAGTTTNSVGYFAIPSLPPGTYRVRVSYLGYETLDTTLTARAAAATLALTPTPITSEGVVVEAGPSDSDDASRPPGMMNVALDRVEQLPSLGEPDLFKALQWTPNIRKSAVVSGGLSIRGADPDQNLYLLDGAPVYHPWHAFSLISTFQTGTLQSTTFYRGSFPASVGGRLSAVLDAQMKDGRRDDTRAVAALSVLSGRFRIEAPVTSKTSFMLSGRRSYLDKLIGRTHPVTDATGRRDTLRTGYYFYDTSAKVTHQFAPGHRLSVSYYRGRDDLDLRLPFDLSLDFSSWLRPADLFFEVDQSWENRVLSVQHRFLPRDDVFVSTTAYYSGYRADENAFVQPTSSASLASLYSVDLDDMGVQANVDYYRSVTHHVQGGVRLSGLRFRSTLDSQIRRSAGTVDTLAQRSPLDAMQAAAYLQDAWSPSPRWTVQPGVRLSYFSGGDRWHLRPRLSLRYAAHPRWLVLRGAVGMHVQYLHRLRDRYSLAYDLVSSRWVPSGDAIRPSSNTQVQVGFNSHPWPALTLDLTGYARRTKHLLVPKDAFQTRDGLQGPGVEVAALLGQYTEADGRAFGVESTARLEHDAWTLRAGLALGRTFVNVPTDAGRRWRAADLDVPVSARTALTWSHGPWETTLAAELRSGYPITIPEARFRVGDPVAEEPTTFLSRPQVNNGRLPTYARVDASILYRFRLLTASWEARLNLFNVLNRGNVVSRTFAPTDTGVEVSSQRGLPLLPLLELEMTL